MKKVLLSAALLLGITVGSEAQTLTVINTSGCPLTIYPRGTDAGGFTIWGPGTTIPGMMPAPGLTFTAANGGGVTTFRWEWTNLNATFPGPAAPGQEQYGFVGSANYPGFGWGPSSTWLNTPCGTMVNMTWTHTAYGNSSVNIF